MELRKVSASNRKKMIIEILSTSFSDSETNDIVENLKLYFEEGSDLFVYVDGTDNIGFTVLSSYTETKGIVEELVLDEFYFKEEVLDESKRNALATQINKISDKFKPKKIEIIVSQDNAWFGDILSNSGFVCETIKLEKVLPNEKNLGDVIELINDSVPKEFISNDILQVLLERDHEYKTEIIVADEDINQVVNEDWKPIMVVFSFEPKDQNIAEIISNSNQLISWDDFEIIYSI